MRIMFVCHGNICRSPMAEVVLKKLLSQMGKEKEVLVVSSALSSEELGNPIYAPAAAVLRKNGYTPDKNKRAVQFTARDYDCYDLILVMDSLNLSRMLRFTDGDPDRKVRRLMDAAKIGGDVEDPWYTDDFDGVFSQIESACRFLSENLELLIAK